ncbi:hypothetical protein B0T18DRAFT_34548 [Schizothecium vesticola]|uniref:Uncharacterized protein n=1 Tax=Schizothecium vesticola TaxID=314040 RepID=A0AA40KCM0_9PEZI|nr:hypothetical protein B0T18DRAFT_34548 [Schizothecium vesticola]
MIFLLSLDRFPNPTNNTEESLARRSGGGSSLSTRIPGDTCHFARYPLDMSEEPLSLEKSHRREEVGVPEYHSLPPTQNPTGPLTPPDGSEIRASNMASTSRLLQHLEEAGRIEASILKCTKVHKVMKAITKLDPDKIPCEEEYRFISRARDLLDLYLNVLAENTEGKETRPLEEALDRVLVIGSTDSTREASTGDDARKPVALGVSTVNRKSSTDQWIWVDKEDDARSASERPMTRHPGWDNGSVEGPPERGDETKQEYETRLWRWAERGGS